MKTLPSSKQYVALASAARTADATSETIESPLTKGVHVVIDVTAVTATPSVVPKIQAYDIASATWYDILVGAAITGVSQVVLRVYPGCIAVTNLVANDAMPPRFRVFMDHADTDSITYSVGLTCLL